MLKQLLDHCGVSADVTEESFPENYFPIVDNYIVFQTGSERSSQVYNHYFEVIGKISKYLKENDIQIIQVGDQNDPFVPNAIDLRGKVHPRQLAHIIKCSKVCITSNTFASKLARVYGTPVVIIGSGFPMNAALKSFKKYTYLEPDLEGKKWNFKVDDPDKLVNNIRPESICSAILEYLNIEHEPFPETIYIGKHYGAEMFDFVPDSGLPQNLVGKTINLRLDLYFNRLAAEQLSNVCKLNIITKESFDLGAVNLSNILSITYFCHSTINIDFVKECKDKGIALTVICTNEDSINEIRFKLLGITEVYKKKGENLLDKFKNCASMFRSSRILFGRNKIYASIYHYKRDISTDLMGTLLPTSDEDFNEFSDFIYIFKTQSS